MRDDAIVDDSPDVWRDDEIELAFVGADVHADRFGFAYADCDLDRNAHAHADVDSNIDSGGVPSLLAADPAALAALAGLPAARPAASSPVPLLRFGPTLARRHTDV